MYSMKMGAGSCFRVNSSRFRYKEITLKGEFIMNSYLSISSSRKNSSYLCTGRILCINQAEQSNKDINNGEEEEKMQNYSTFDLKAYMHKRTSAINQALDKAVPLREPIKIHEAIRYSLLAEGKRVCPILCIACCELVGGDETTALPAACSMEMIVASHQILDDLPCVDNDDLRRGKPSNHKAFGEYVAVYAASALTILAFENISNRAAGSTCASWSENSLRMVGELASLMGPREGAIAGQMADMENEGVGDMFKYNGSSNKFKDKINLSFKSCDKHTFLKALFAPFSMQKIQSKYPFRIK